MMNSVKSKRKLSEIETKISFLLLQLFFVQVVDCDQVVICVVHAILYVLWKANNRDQVEYLHIDTKSYVAEFFIKFGNWMLIFGYASLK